MYPFMYFVVYLVGMKLFWGRLGQESSELRSMRDAVHSVRTRPIRLECGPFGGGFCSRDNIILG